MQRSINILWTPACAGKTEFMFDMAKAIVAKSQEVAFLDVDNSLDLLARQKLWYSHQRD
jgi:late competence protein required for DNA uptake (superfamily II DNA/RNA helicase)